LLKEKHTSTLALDQPWNGTPGQHKLVVEEAGGKVVRFEDNQTFTYNKENLLNGYFVVYGEMG
jgi:3'-phosphoadenosine 5'-phosphosulfate (PAPS) 3'-phosphatase